MMKKRYKITLITDNTKQVFYVNKEKFNKIEKLLFSEEKIK